MTSSPSLFRSFSAVFLALAYTMLTFGAALTPTAAEARGSAVYYTAELATPVADTRIIASGVAWQCEGTRCIAAKSNSRAVFTCKRLVREAGEVISFTANGDALSAEELARCNGK